jgi:hypothetical protein
MQNGILSKQNHGIQEDQPNVKIMFHEKRGAEKKRIL